MKRYCDTCGAGVKRFESGTWTHDGSNFMLVLTAGEHMPYPRMSETEQKANAIATALAELVAAYNDEPKEFDDPAPMIDDIDPMLDAIIKRMNIRVEDWA